ICAKHICRGARYFRVVVIYRLTLHFGGAQLRRSPSRAAHQKHRKPNLAMDFSDGYTNSRRRPCDSSSPSTIPSVFRTKEVSMKVVLCRGGQGLRMREFSDTIPKPMVNIGSRPILWHVMKYYAHYGHKDFILCLGYGADVIKNYFLNYNECISNDFVLSRGGKKLQL